MYGFTEKSVSYRTPAAVPIIYVGISCMWQYACVYLLHRLPTCVYLLYMLPACVYLLYMLPACVYLLHGLPACVCISAAGFEMRHWAVLQCNISA